MTSQERAEVIAGQEELRGLIATSNATLTGAIDTLKARVDAHLDKTSSETRTLFASRREHMEKIHKIEMDYVPRGEFEKERRERHESFERHRQENREEHQAFAETLGKTQWRLAAISGGISLAAFLAGLAVKAVFP